MPVLPKVSIGLPVFNGENYLNAAVESLLAQTFGDFELIISDNCSNDATQSICRDFAAQDARIRYFRADHNRGASWNHDFVIHKARAAYFKLAAHDDVCLPTHLQRCVEALDDNPQAPLAYTRTTMRFEGEKPRQQIYLDQVDLQSTNPAIRFGDLIHEAPPAFPVFGVLRRDRLLSIPLFEPYKASDRVVLARLALMGPFIEIAEPLFVYRWHQSNASNLMASGSGFYTWWNPKKGHGRVYPQARLAYEFLRSAWLVAMPWRQRRAVLREAWDWSWLQRRRIAGELGQLVGRPRPEMPPVSFIQKALQRKQRANYKARHYPQPD